MLLLTCHRLPGPLREWVYINDSQGIRQPDIDQAMMEKPQRRGQYMLHAVFGRLEFHEILVPRYDCRKTVCILIVPPNANGGFTFGLVVYGQSWAVRKLQFYPHETFHHELNIRGDGRVEIVSQ